VFCGFPQRFFMSGNLDIEPASPGQLSLPGLGHRLEIVRNRAVEQMPRISAGDVGRNCAVALLCFLGGWAGFSKVLPEVGAIPVWRPAGIALAAVLLLGYRVWPGVFLGVMLTGFVGPFRSPALLTMIASGAGGGTTHSLAAVAGAWLVRRFAGGRTAFEYPFNALKFVVFAAASAAISSTLGMRGLSLIGLARWHHLADTSDTWLIRWLADLGSNIVLVPFLVTWSAKRLPALEIKRIIEAAGLVLLLALLCEILFGGWLPAQIKMGPLVLLVIPILLWPPLRFGQRATTAAVVVVASVVMWGSLRSAGSFAVENRTTRVLMAQEFIAVISLMALVLSADVVQRQKTDDSLRASQQRYRDLFENNPQPVWVCDYDSLRCLAVNQATLRLYGYSREEFLGLPLDGLLPPEEAPAVLEAVALARRGTNTSMRGRHRRKDGKLLNIEMAWRTLVFDGRPAMLLLSSDLTEHDRTEQRAAAFSNLGCRLSSASTPQFAAQIITDIADTLLGWDACAFDLWSAGQDRLVPILRVNRIDASQPQSGVSGGPANRPSPHAEGVAERGARLVRLADPPGMLMSVPVRNGEKIMGILSLISYRPNAYTDEDLRTLHALADHCGGALERIRTLEELTQSNERLRLALAASKMGIWTVELRGQPQYIGSPELEAVFGMKPGEFAQTQEAALALIHAEDRPLVRQAMAYALTDEDEHEVEFRFLPRNRPMGWMLVRGRAYKNSLGQPVRLAGVGIDITQLKQAEEEILRLNAELELRVGRRTSQLEATNKELEAFCYSVSHDLRAPLRSIRGFSEVLLERYGAGLDARGREFLRRACDSCAHMDTLIDDLLKLSRVSRAELAHQLVDLSAMAQNIAAELNKAEPQRDVQWVVAPDLQGVGDERLLRVVLENLLRNAWKFTSKHPGARIEFGFAPKPEPAFFVRDNGAGFDMEFADKLFGVFQRLHSANEFPGTGVGLATVRRIVSRHGGRVWATGAVNQGAVFYFTLPGDRTA
jgi:PAS domain S-box-containing protein